MTIGLNRDLSDNKISVEDKRKLLLVVSEMKSRGIPIPEGFHLPETKIDATWGLGGNGYFVKRDGTIFNPRPELEEFIKDESRFILLKSGRGGGKTVAGAQKVMFKIMAGESGAVMNPDFENFRTSTWTELRDWIPWKMVVSKHKYRASSSWEPIRPFSIVFVNGAVLYCKGLKDPESARGSNVNFFWYDEGRRDPTGLGWKNAIAFCRVGNMPQAWCTTTPAGTDHWTTKFFESEATDELKDVVEDLRRRGVNQNLFSVYKTSTKANSDNLAPGYYASLLSAYPSGYLRARELEGEAADEGGSLGDRMWFNGKELPENPDWGVKYVRFWDLAATERKILMGKKINDPDEAVGTLLCTDAERKLELKKYAICDQISGFWEWKALKDTIRKIAERDGIMVPIVFEQEPASGGKNQVAALKEYLAEVLPGWKVYGLEAKKVGDRVMAANIWFGEAANGQFYYVKGLWNEGFFSQLDRFNGMFHDDRITSVSGGRHWIAPIRKWSRGGVVSV